MLPFSGGYRATAAFDHPSSTGSYASYSPDDMSYEHKGGLRYGSFHDFTAQPGLAAPQRPKQEPALAQHVTTTAKRGSKACVACRKGKNRCEADPSSPLEACRRCTANGIACVYEKPTNRAQRNRNGNVSGEVLGEAEVRVTTLEKTVEALATGQSQIQSTLQHILSLLPTGRALSTPSSVPSYLPHQSDHGVPTANIFQQSASPPNIFEQPSSAAAQLFNAVSASTAAPSSPQNMASGRTSVSSQKHEKPQFPKLPGFAPPNHRFGTYGIIPLSSAPPSPTRSRRSSLSSSDSEESDSALPHDSLSAPIQALQALANAADQAAATRDGDEGGEEHEDVVIHITPGSTHEEPQTGDKRKRVRIDGKVHLRVKKKTKPDPTPRNPFPDVVTKGLVSEVEARELWDIFFSGCHYFVSLWDKTYDTYEAFVERTPFSFNGLLAVAAKIRAGTGPVGPTFQRCLEEAQGIARSTLFGPIVRKEAVMAMLILSVWSQNGWLPCGHALRAGLDINLHRALDKLANDQAEPRTDAEERDLVVSARIWLNCFLQDRLVSLGSGKPLLLRDESSVKHARVLLNHPMASETDIRLIAGVELVNLRARVFDRLSAVHGDPDAETTSYVRQAFTELRAWYDEWHTIHRQRLDEDSVLVKLLESELMHAQMWTVCLAMRGSQWNKLKDEQQSLVFEAKDAALRCIEIFLRSPNFRAHLKYATHEQLVAVAFTAVFLLKIAVLYPTELSMPSLIAQVAELAHVLSAECFAERYAITLRLMLSNFRRKAGIMSTVPGTPRAPGTLDGTLPSNPFVNVSAVGELDGGLQSLLSLPQAEGGVIADGVFNSMADWGSMDGLDGFAWPNEFSPSNLPVWLQDGNFTDLGLPVDGSDSLFLPPELANLFLPAGGGSNLQFGLPDSEDVGAEAW